MFIKDLTKLASKEKCKALAERLHKAAKARELSYTGRGYAISIDQAADGDDNVALALGASWNECMDFIEKQLGPNSIDW